MILAVDPSSKRTGYALMIGRKIVAAGVLIPKSRDSAVERIRAQCLDLYELIAEHGPGVAVIEITSGRPGTGLARGAGARLGVYGMAVGAMMCALWQHMAPDAVVTVDEQVWTLGHPKAMRRSRIARQYPRYARAVFGGKKEKDRGGDMSDAIGIGLWYDDHRVMRGLG